MGRDTPPWRNSDRKHDLPANWPALRAEAARRNPARTCHWCKKPGGEALDHINGQRTDHRQENLDWIHDWRSVRNHLSSVNCHAQKTRADRQSVHRTETHPARA